jgi:hypothetical protein
MRKITVALLILATLTGCKTNSPSHISLAKQSPTYKNSAKSVKENKRKELPASEIQKIDALILKWYNANNGGDDVKIVQLSSKITKIAKRKKGEIKKYLEEYLQKSPTKKREYVLVYLVLTGFTDDCSFVPLLKKYLSIYDSHIIAHTLLGLSNLNNCEIPMTPIFKLLKEDSDERIILNGLQVIHKSKENIASNLLEELVDKYINHRNPLIQNQAIRIIAKYKLKRYKDILLNNFLTHPITFVRTNCAIALARIGDKSLIKPLIEKINEPIFIGKKEAVYVLESITGEKFGLDNQAWLFWYVKNFESEK